MVTQEILNAAQSGKPILLKDGQFCGVNGYFEYADLQTVCASHSTPLKLRIYAAHNGENFNRFLVVEKLPRDEVDSH